MSSPAVHGLHLGTHHAGDARSTNKSVLLLILALAAAAAHSLPESPPSSSQPLANTSKVVDDKHNHEANPRRRRLQQTESPTASPTSPPTSSPTLMHFHVSGNGGRGRLVLDHLNDRTLPSLGLMGLGVGKWGEYLVNPVTGLTSKAWDIGMNWREKFEIRATVDNNNVYKNDGTHNNNLKAKVEAKYGWTPEETQPALTVWNVAKLVMREHPKVTGFLWRQQKVRLSNTRFASTVDVRPTSPDLAANFTTAQIDRAVLLALPRNMYNKHVFSLEVINGKSKVVLRI